MRIRVTCGTNGEDGLSFTQLHHVAHARGGGWRCVRKDLLHNPAGNAALLRDLRPLPSIVIVVQVEEPAGRFTPFP